MKDVRLSFLITGNHGRLLASRLSCWQVRLLSRQISRLIASKHDFFLSGMISCWLSFTCTVQFLLSTAKGRCLMVKIHLRISFFLIGQGGLDGRLVLHLTSILGERTGNSCPLRHEGSAVVLSEALGPKELSPTASHRRAELIEIHERPIVQKSCKRRADQGCRPSGRPSCCCSFREESE